MINLEFFLGFFCESGPRSGSIRKVGTNYRVHGVILDASVDGRYPCSWTVLAKIISRQLKL